MAVSGGTITALGIGLFDEGSGAVTFSSGTLTSIGDGNDNTALDADGSGTLAVSGGDITAAGQYGAGLATQGAGPVTVSGGTLTGGVDGYGLAVGFGSGAVTVSGGTLTAGDGGDGIEANGAFINGSTVPISGAVTITGGNITGGMGGYGLNAESGIINLFSKGNTPFTVQYDGMAGYSTIYSGSLEEGIGGTISGTLLNGDVLDTTFFNGDDGSTINLNVGNPPSAAVPEPAPVFLLGLGLPGLILTARKRRGCLG